MALPADAGTVFSDGDSLPAAEINTIKDCITGGKHGEVTLLLGPAQAQGADNATATPGFATATYTWKHTGSGTTERVIAPIPLRVGDRIKAIKVYGRESASDEYDAALYERTPGSLPTQLGATKISGTTNAVTSVTLSSADGGSTPLPYTLVADRYYYLEIGLTGANTEYIMAAVTYDRP